MNISAHDEIRSLARAYLHLGKLRDASVAIKECPPDLETIELIETYARADPYGSIFLTRRQLTDHKSEIDLLLDDVELIESPAREGIEKCVGILRGLDIALNKEVGELLYELGLWMSLSTSEWAQDQSSVVLEYASECGVTQELWLLKTRWDELERRENEDGYEQVEEELNALLNESESIPGGKVYAALALCQMSFSLWEEGASLLRTLPHSDPLHASACHFLLSETRDLLMWEPISDRIELAEEMTRGWITTVLEEEERKELEQVTYRSSFLLCAYDAFLELKRMWLRRNLPGPWAKPYAMDHICPEQVHSTRSDFLTGTSGLDSEDMYRWVAEHSRWTVEKFREIVSPLTAEMREKSVSDLILEGESQHLEFKETFFYDIGKQRPSDAVCMACIKTIAGFLNSDGGTLLIGVSDENEIRGLDRDLSLLREEKRDLDGFEIRLRDKVASSLIPKPTQLLKVTFPEAGKVCRVDVPKSKGTVVFHVGNKEKNTEDVFVRDGNRTLKLTGKSLLDWVTARRASSLGA